jgi:hypothetical protein
VLQFSTPLLSNCSFFLIIHISTYIQETTTKKEVVAILVKNQLVIDRERIMMCVFMDYFLPGMARLGSTMVGNDLTTLALNIILNIVSKIHFVWKVKKPNELSSDPPPEFHIETKWYDIEWSMVSNIYT